MAKKIMVVDDSKVAQLQLQRILSDSPYEVISCCQNGEDAVEQYRVLKPDLITMDILMPGLDGLEAAGFKAQSAEVTMIPSTEAELDAETAPKLMRLIDMLEDLDDVQEVYHNGSISDEVAATL